VLAAGTAVTVRIVGDIEVRKSQAVNRLKITSMTMAIIKDTDMAVLVVSAARAVPGPTAFTLAAQM
jgi:hypothetical protein